MQEWNNFYVAVAGSAAALTGLLFVGISISLTKILSNPRLPMRASVSLTLLLSILIFSVLLLVPQKTLTCIGYEITILGFIVWGIVTRTDFKIHKQVPKEYKRQSLFYLFIDQLAIIPYVIGGFCILFIGEVGLYWLVPAIVLSFTKAVLDAWVLLVEINR
ncbi:modulator of FtsH protease [Chitinophaga sp. YR573]|uniref:hypothetical protein n=1 Tax=Chitinophaga sp. YR573 TaxID=1881040 RepID=UPI0008D3F0C4|nr:hypothetical protein [Chitinophaga sp. YR573]SEV95317.1 modulator of FtsH protease [Chitinophaga sp. YR573]